MIRVASWGAHYGALSCAEIFESAMQLADLRGHAASLDSSGEAGFEAPDCTRVSRLASVASVLLETAWHKAGLPHTKNRLDGKGPRARFNNTALIVGSSLGHLDEALTFADQPPKRPGPFTLSRLRGNSLVAPLAIRFGLGAGTHVVSAASATGGHALVSAGQLIKSGQAERVVVLCIDAVTHPTLERTLGTIGAVSADPHSSPLSANRSGMRPVPAAAVIILESEQSCAQRGHATTVRWISGAVRNDCHHLLAPEPTNTALIEAHTATLVSSGFKSDDIDWLSMHATGTQLWDKLEAQAVERLFGDEQPHISAFKRTFGHTLGAAGLFEAAMLVEALSQGRISAPLTDIDKSLPLRPKTVLRSPTNAMMWSAGMGGDIAVNLFARADSRVN